MVNLKQNVCTKEDRDHVLKTQIIMFINRVWKLNMHLSCTRITSHVVLNWWLMVSFSS